MTLILRPIACAVGFALLTTPLSATAQNAARYESARQIVAEKLGADFTQRQVAALNVVAHSTAVSILCDQLDLDEAAVRTRLQAVLAESPPATSASAAQNGLRDRMLVGFGALLGLMLEEAVPNNPRFCSAAEADMKKEGATSLLRPHVAR